MAAVSSQPRPMAFVLVPGAGWLPEMFDRVTSRLEAQGLRCHAIHLPSVGKDRSLNDKGHGPASFYDDAAYVNKICGEFCDAGHDVVLAGNSYGGMVITQAAQGLPRLERTEAGREGGSLIRLVYLASSFPKLDQNLFDIVNGKAPFDLKAPVDYHAGLDPDIGGPMLCSELTDKAERLRYGAMNTWQSTKTYYDKITYVGYEHIPTTFVVATKDVCFPVAIQHESVDAAIARGVKTVKKIEIPGDHLIMASLPDDVVNILLDDARSPR